MKPSWEAQRHIYGDNFIADDIDTNTPTASQPDEAHKEEKEKKGFKLTMQTPSELVDYLSQMIKNVRGDQSKKMTNNA